MSNWSACRTCRAASSSDASVEVAVEEGDEYERVELGHEGDRVEVLAACGRSPAGARCGRRVGFVDAGVHGREQRPGRTVLERPPVG